MERHLPRDGSLARGQRRGADARILAALATPDGHRGGPGRCPMTAMAPSQQAISRQQVEEFLYTEAALLDAWALGDWLLLFDDNYARLASRVNRLNSRRAHREYPHSRTNHQVFNVRVQDTSAEELSVTTSFTVWRFRAGRT